TFGCIRATYFVPTDDPFASAEQVLRNTRRLEDVVARCFELLAQLGQIEVEQPPLPFAHLARNDHGLYVGSVHERYDRARHVIDRRHIDGGGVEQNDVSLIAGFERTNLAVQPQGLRTVHGGEAQYVAHVEERRGARRWRRPLIGWSEVSLIEDHLVHN